MDHGTEKNIYAARRRRTYVGDCDRTDTIQSRRLPLRGHDMSDCRCVVGISMYVQKMAALRLRDLGRKLSIQSEPRDRKPI